MFVLAGGAVGTSAGAEFDFAPVEVFLEFGPLLVGRVAVLALGTDMASVLEVLLVVADDVLVEDRDVSTSGLDVEVAQQGGADVDGQSAVDEFRREDPSEVVRGELQPSEFVVRLGELFAEPGEHDLEGRAAEDHRGRAVLPLEEERHRCAPHLVVVVEPADQRDRPVRVWRRMTEATTWKSSADIGMTRSRSVFEGAMTRSAMTSPSAR